MKKMQEQGQKEARIVAQKLPEQCENDARTLTNPAVKDARTVT